MFTSKVNNYCQRADLKWPDGSVADVTGKSTKKREWIRDLSAGVIKGFLAGIIIAKQDARSFVDRKDPSQLRWHVKMTLRDSASDFINMCCWGGEAYIQDIANSFRIGDTVELENALVQSKLHTEAEEKYNPSTPSPFSLVVNERYAGLQHYGGADEFKSMAFLPIKEGSDYYTLGDVVASGRDLHGSHINILAALRDAGFKKDIVTKTGKEIVRRELKIFDESCNSFPLVMWDNELSDLVNTWNPGEVVLFLADVKVHFDDFKKLMVATCDCKTIITVNPDLPEAHHLYSYAQSVDLKDASDPSEDAPVDIENIEDTFTVEQLQEKISHAKAADLPSNFYGIVFACITQFDLDCHDALDKLAVSRCSSCKSRLELKQSSCSNKNCTSLYGGNTASNAVLRQLDLRVELSDSTGGISNVRLRGNAAEKVIGYSLDKFMTMNMVERTEVKWKYLLERYKIFVKCSVGRPDNHVYLDILHAEQLEVSQAPQYSKVPPISARYTTRYV